MSMQPLEIIITIMMVISGFALTAMYNKFDSALVAFGKKIDDGAKSINELNQNIAIAVNNQTHITERLKKNESEVERLWDNHAKAREALHEIRNSLSQVEINKIEIEKIKAVGA